LACTRRTALWCGERASARRSARARRSLCRSTTGLLRIITLDTTASFARFVFISSRARVFLFVDSWTAFVQCCASRKHGVVRMDSQLQNTSMDTPPHHATHKLATRHASLDLNRPGPQMWSKPLKPIPRVKQGPLYASAVNMSPHAPQLGSCPDNAPPKRAYNSCHHGKLDSLFARPPKLRSNIRDKLRRCDSQ